MGSLPFFSSLSLPSLRWRTVWKVWSSKRGIDELTIIGSQVSPAHSQGIPRYIQVNYGRSDALLLTNDVGASFWISVFCANRSLFAIHGQPSPHKNRPAGSLAPSDFFCGWLDPLPRQLIPQAQLTTLYHFMVKISPRAQSTILYRLRVNSARGLIKKNERIT